MKIKLVIKDAEYRNALLQAISVADREILAEIAAVPSDLQDCMCVTDDPRLLLDEGGELNSRMIVYISECARDKRLEPPGPYVLFKYEHIDVIISELILCNYLATGNGIERLGAGRILCVCSDSTVRSTDFVQRFARNLAYRTDERVLVISLKYTNPYGTTAGDPMCVHRMFYYFRKNGDVSIDSFTLRDKYEVYHLATDMGWNFLMDISARELQDLITCLRKYFHHVILDVGECYCRSNIEILANAGSVVFLSEENSRRRYDSILRSMVMEYEEKDNVKVFKTSVMPDERYGEIIKEYLR